MHRHVLIISPHFPPINAPDHQRVRMSLPYFQKFGWQPHILTVQAECVQRGQDPDLIQTIPSDIEIDRIPALPTQLTKWVGLNDLGWRCLPFLSLKGQQLLRQKRFDLVYFSTTVFLTMGLAPIWKRSLGIPYVLDLQDPWLKDSALTSQTASVPGGRLKYGFSQWVARQLEPQAMQNVEHVISVSPEYPQTLLKRYPELNEKQFSVLPFGASEQDFEILPSLQIKQSIFDAKDGKKHWVYIGRGGSDMAFAVRSLFLAIQLDRRQHPDRWNAIKLHFVGTSYAPKERAVKTIEPIAYEFGVADLVEEITARIPYFEALQTLVESDAILLIGSHESGYTASKIYPCILAEKPILAIFHQHSSVVNILNQCRVGQVVSFQSSDRPETLLFQIRSRLHWLHSLPKYYKPETNWQAFVPYTAQEMTRKQCAIFNQIANQKGSGS